MIAWARERNWTGTETFFAACLVPGTIVKKKNVVMWIVASLNLCEQWEWAVSPRNYPVTTVDHVLVTHR